MRQSRIMSMVEAATNVTVGYVLAIATRDASRSRGSASPPASGAPDYRTFFIGFSLARSYLCAGRSRGCADAAACLTGGHRCSYLTWQKDKRIGGMRDQESIRERLAKLEALFARGATEGERAAAGAAMERLQARLDRAAPPQDETEIELQYSLPDVWAVRLFVALCRRHGITPYRYPRQRRTTVMVYVRKSTFEQTIASEFQALYQELTAYFDETVHHLIANAMHSDGDDETLEQRQIGHR